MMTAGTFVRLIGCGVLVAAAGTGLQAQSGRVLPPLNVTQLDGAELPAGSFDVPGRWLLIAVRPGCAPCDRVLARVATHPELAPRIVIVVTGVSTAHAKSLSDRYAALGACRWTVDTSGDAGRLLRTRGLPTVYGMQGATIAWKLTGPPSSDEELDSALFSWMELGPEGE